MVNSKLPWSRLVVVLITIAATATSTAGASAIGIAAEVSTGEVQDSALVGERRLSSVICPSPRLRSSTTPTGLASHEICKVSKMGDESLFRIFGLGTGCCMRDSKHGLLLAALVHKEDVFFILMA
ncbi:hypothetical protein LguiB_026427 [Lonicera macranthoides]